MTDGICFASDHIEFEICEKNADIVIKTVKTVIKGLSEPLVGGFKCVVYRKYSVANTL